MVVTSIEYHQKRGAAWDIIDEALLAYDRWMLDDDYDANRALREIMGKMKERRELYRSGAPSGSETHP